MGGGQFCAKMSDGEVETPVEAPAPAVGEPLDLMSALQMVLKKSMACHSLLRGLHEVARTIEKGEAQLVVLAQDCDNGDYVKLVGPVQGEVHLPPQGSKEGAARRVVWTVQD